MELNQSIKNLRSAFKEYILSGKADIKFFEQSNPAYLFDMRVFFNNSPFDYVDFSVAPTYICYHNPLVRDAFLKSDIPAIVKLYSERVESLEEMRQKKVRELRDEIDKIING